MPRRDVAATAVMLVPLDEIATAARYLVASVLAGLLALLVLKRSAGRSP